MTEFNPKTVQIYESIIKIRYLFKVYSELFDKDLILKREQHEAKANLLNYKNHQVEGTMGEFQEHLDKYKEINSEYIANNNP